MIGYTEGRLDTNVDLNKERAEIEELLNKAATRDELNRLTSETGTAVEEVGERFDAVEDSVDGIEERIYDLEKRNLILSLTIGAAVGILGIVVFELVKK